METPDFDRMTILERAQHLHDATLRRHGEMLDRQEDARVTHTDQLATLQRLSDQQAILNAQLLQLTARLAEEQGHHADALFRADVAVRSLQQEQDRHAERLERSEMLLSALASEHMEHAERLYHYDIIIARLDEESARHAERMERLDQILQAIKDMLDRGNGH